MLKLRFAEPHERAPRPPDDEGPDVQIWLNRKGGVVAWGFRHSGLYWMAWPNLATYGFRVGESSIAAYPEPGAPVDVIWDTYRRVVLPMALQVNGWEALHASAVMTRRGVVAFCAVSETGKSTIAYGLRRRGFPQWSDDGVVFGVDHQAILSVPLPFEVRLRPGSRTMFGEHVSTPNRPLDNTPGEQIHTDPQPLAAICVLTRSESGSNDHPRISDLPPATAFRSILAHAHEFDPSDADRRARMMQAYLTLVDRVPMREVTFSPDRERLHLLLDTICEGVNLELPAPTPLCAP
jgi:hypothetical protein